MSFFSWAVAPTEKVIPVAYLTLGSPGVWSHEIRLLMIWILLRKLHWRLSFWTQAFVLILFCSLAALSFEFESLLSRNVLSCGNLCHFDSFPGSTSLLWFPGALRQLVDLLHLQQSQPEQHRRTPVNKPTAVVLQFQENFYRPILKYQKTCRRRLPSFAGFFQQAWLTWVQAQQYLGIAAANQSLPEAPPTSALASQSQCSYLTSWSLPLAAHALSPTQRSLSFFQLMHKLP